MNVHKIPDALASQYHGAGLGLVAVSGGQVVAVRYLRNVAPALVDHIDMDGEHDVFFARQWLQTAEAGAVVRELQALGQVSIGMLSCWEFIEL